MPSVAATNKSGESVEKGWCSCLPSMLYAQANRFRLRKANPDARFGLIGKLLHSEWSGLTDDKKRPYIERYEEDKIRFEGDKAKYIDEMAEYEAKKAKYGYASESEGV
ncbi:hypothetical protein DL89DRAFT_265826 [Linderina pennispora]|uniref:HMG box domain-containing protein n=1 Tax=Linderina pennispora TaxID=61395 RepID=A0A1Y1WFE6_9FUNG|nr:uncharacterized protein DL89DRAFT_265826 [Linderina pennispora]ORX72202.1 hypothetical protein DL89DRAFT_265826 [Linderina pennispora]